MDDFHNHLDVCKWCMDHPFNLCILGTKLMQEAVPPKAKTVEEFSHRMTLRANALNDVVNAARRTVEEYGSLESRVALNDCLIKYDNTK